MFQRGKFICFEGLDRSGKTTQAKYLEKYLKEQNFQSKLFNFPNIGKIIDNALKGKEQQNKYALHLLFSANRWERHDEIMSELKQGTHIIADRYAYSGVAYSLSQGLDHHFCLATDQGLPCPDAVIFMQINQNIQTHRQDFGQEIYDSIQFQKKILKYYQSLVQNNWHFIDANQDQNIIHKQVIDIFHQLNINQQINKLWNLQL